MAAKIYIAVTVEWTEGDVGATALAEDGTVLAEHLSSSTAFAKSDMGLTTPISGIGQQKHKRYASHYPDGYELVWVDDADNHTGWSDACKLNHQKYGQVNQSQPEE